MRKTTVHLDDPQYHQIAFLARQHEIPKAEAIRQLVSDALARRQIQHRKRLFKALNQVKGTVASGDPHFTETIDETLYGEKGAWHPSHNHA